MLFRVTKETDLEVKNLAGLVNVLCLDSERGEAGLPKEHSEV